MDHYSDENLPTVPPDEQSSTAFFQALGLQTLNDHAFNVNQEDSKHTKDNEDDQTLEFFHSLGLQTLQEASKRGDSSKTPLELKDDVQDDFVPGKGSVDATTAQDLLEVNLWSAVNSDISFVESLGLYWLDPCTDGNQDSLSANDASIVANDTSMITNDDAATNATIAVHDASKHNDISINNAAVKESTSEQDECRIESASPVVAEDLVNDALETEEEKDEKSALIDFDDCLNLLGITSKSDPSGKRWRLWNPGLSDDLDSTCYSNPDSQQDRHHQQQQEEMSSQETDPTLVEDHANKLAGKRKIEERTTLSEIENELSNKPSKGLLTRHLELPEKIVTSKQLTPTKKRPKLLPIKTDLQQHSDDERQFKFQSNKQDDSKSNVKGKEENNILAQSVEQIVQPVHEVISCSSCGAKVQPHQLGKHLISHYHYHRSIGHNEEKELILSNISSIIHQSPYQCKPCQFYCNWHRDLKDHVNKHNISGIFWCLICIKILKCNEDLCNHLESEDHRDLISVINRSVPTIIQRIDINTCALCNQTFRLRVGLKRHMRYVHGCQDFILDDHKKIFCKYCEFSSYKQKAVETHTFLVHRDKRLEYTCNVCRQDFISIDEVKRHRNSVEHKENVSVLKDPDIGKQCQICWKQCLSGITDLKKHMESEHYSLLPQCNLCGQVFYFSQQLKGHVKSKCKILSGLPRPEGGEFSCTVPNCLFNTNSQWRLLRHRRIKHRERADEKDEVKCRQCYRKFFCTEQLQHHIQKFHKAVETVACDEPGCQYKSDKQKLLSLHIKRAHGALSQITTKETYSCAICCKEYQSKCGLKAHMDANHHCHNLNNSRVPNFICDTAGCDAKFFYKSDLQRHILKHDSEGMLFSCDKCNFTTKRKSDLTRHIKHKHDESQEQLKCDFCSYETKNGSHMKRHNRLKHGKQPDVDFLTVDVDPKKVFIVNVADNFVQEVDV